MLRSNVGSFYYGENMDLFEGEIVVNLENELKRAKRIYTNNNSNVPKFIFLCGKQILDDKGLIDKEKTINSIIYYIKELLEKKKSKNHNNYFCIL